MRYISNSKPRGVNVGMRSILVAVAILMIPWHPVPRDEFRAPVLHSPAAIAAWHGFQALVRTCDRDFSRLASTCGSALGLHASTAAQVITVPKTADLPVAPVPLDATDHPDASDSDLAGMDGRTDLKLTRDPNVTPTEMYNSVKTAFTPVPARPAALRSNF